MSAPSSRDPRPLVAVSASVRTHDGVARVRLNQAYVRALELAGLVPIVVPPLADAGDARRILATVQGLVLTGGEDVDPSAYGEAPHPTVTHVVPERDRTELALFHAAREARLPTLAICRGIQLVNVALGGTLVQDLPTQRPDAIAHDQDAPRAARTHHVSLDPSSRLAQAIGASRCDVNTMHHQAIAHLASALRATAHAPDGTIEGVEGTDPDWWLLGVQWHPEELVATAEPWDRALFEAFAEAVRGHVALRV